MPDDVKLVQPERPAADTGSLEASGGREPVPPPVAATHNSAENSPASERCRTCLGALAHRLAQAATALRGGMELALLQKRSVAEYRSTLEQSLQLADHLVQLIVSLRDLAESSAPAGLPESVALEQIVREIQAEVQGLAEAREIQVQLTAEGAASIRVDPGRLRDALQGLLVWVIQNSAEGGVIETEISASDGEAFVSLLPPRWDLQYLQVKVLEDIASPGVLFSQAARNDAMGWAINRRLVEGMGGKLEIVTEGPDAGRIRTRFPLAPAA